MKLNYILDLDNTLISAVPTEEYDFKRYKDKAKQFRFENMDDYYIIFERPGLQDFLDYLFENFNVSIWTAATKDYALFIIEHIILKDHPERKIDWIFFSKHCSISKRNKKGTKDLSMLWDYYKLANYNVYNTVILDDYDEVYDTQPDNCIIAKPFEFTDDKSEKDIFLSSLIPKLERLKSSKKTLAEHLAKINKN
jgi:TFIIF-interacting CTD phosphatase-like protein